MENKYEGYIEIEKTDYPNDRPNHTLLEVVQESRSIHNSIEEMSSNGYKEYFDRSAVGTVPVFIMGRKRDEVLETLRKERKDALAKLRENEKELEEVKEDRNIYAKDFESALHGQTVERERADELYEDCKQTQERLEKCLTQMRNAESYFGKAAWAAMQKETNND